MTTKTDSVTFPDESRRTTRDDGIGGDWFQYEFANGYGASVIRNAYSYGGPQGCWELAVTHGGPLCYATRVTPDVMGWLDEEMVAAALFDIAGLAPEPKCSHRSA